MPWQESAMAFPGYSPFDHQSVIPNRPFPRPQHRRRLRRLPRHQLKTPKIKPIKTVISNGPCLRAWGSGRPLPAGSHPRVGASRPRRRPTPPVGRPHGLPSPTRSPPVGRPHGLPSHRVDNSKKPEASPCSLQLPIGFDHESPTNRTGSGQNRYEDGSDGQI
jgi:hypothetical protein